MLVVERRLLVGGRDALGVPAVAALCTEPRGDRLGRKQQFVRRAVDARLVRARADAVRPPVGPVAAPGRELFGANQAGELGRSREGDPRRAPFVVPAPDEVGQAAIRRPVVDAHRMRRLAPQEVERVVVPVAEPAHDRRQRAIDEPPVAELRDRATEEVMEAVPGEHLAAGGALPPERARERPRRPAPDLVHRHRQQLDPARREQVGEEPADAVDVALHRRAHRQPVLLA